MRARRPPLVRADGRIVDELVQLGICLLCLLERLVHERLGPCAAVYDGLLREFERHDRVHQPLLGAVVEIADGLPALAVGRRALRQSELP